MSYNVDILNKMWEKREEKELDNSIFNDENINESLIHEFILMQLSNKRVPIAHTKNRSDVKASWRKLYRQKWTWRGRVWDAASPLRRKWGVTFWPRKDVNYLKAMNKKSRRKALFGALTIKAKENGIIWLDSFWIETIKTKDAVSVISNLGLNWVKTLVVLDEKNELLVKSLRNISWLKYLLVEYLNPYDLLTYKKILFLEKSLDKLSSVFLK